MREAYSHEVISHGFWPGSGPVLEPAFYAYAAPEPDGLKTAPVAAGRGVSTTRELGEFILPYEAVRTSASPEQRDHAISSTAPTKRQRGSRNGIVQRSSDRSEVKAGSPRSIPRRFAYDEMIVDGGYSHGFRRELKCPGLLGLRVDET